MKRSPSRNTLRLIEGMLAFTASIWIATLVVLDGRLPSPYATLFFLPIVFVAYRQPLALALAIAVLASLFSSPALMVAGVEVDDSVMPVLWLGWPAVYLFLTVSINEWANIRQQRRYLDQAEKSLLEVQTRNDQREQELQAASAIHTVILSGNPERAVVEEVIRQVAQVTGAKICTLVTPVGANGERPLLPRGLSEDLFNDLFPDGAPYGEGVAGWAMLHRRVAASANVFTDPRYDRLKELARAAGYVSAAAAPVELDNDLCGALVICYPEAREFSTEELTRLERLARQAELAIRAARQREALSRFAFDTALVLTEAIESRDPYTGGHCRRLAHYAGLIASKLALPSRDIEVVRLGAALHDMGKIVVPDAILKKTGRLTPEEYTIVKQHCYSGGQICKRAGFLMDAYPIVYHHHERWDGQGYPDGLKGEQIPLGARIVGVVDAYDAMTSDRPYRQALAWEETLAILKDGAGAQWDPQVVRALLEALPDLGGSAPGNELPSHPGACGSGREEEIAGGH